jgi:hypothetical protein
MVGDESPIGHRMESLARWLEADGVQLVERSQEPDGKIYDSGTLVFRGSRRTAEWVARMAADVGLVEIDFRACDAGASRGDEDMLWELRAKLPRD